MSCVYVWIPFLQMITVVTVIAFYVGEQRRIFST
jgi:hypothetical protein